MSILNKQLSQLLHSKNETFASTVQKETLLNLYITLYCQIFPLIGNRILMNLDWLTYEDFKSHRSHPQD